MLLSRTFGTASLLIGLAPAGLADTLEVPGDYGTIPGRHRRLRLRGRGVSLVETVFRSAAKSSASEKGTGRRAQSRFDFCLTKFAC